MKRFLHFFLIATAFLIASVSHAQAPVGKNDGATVSGAEKVQALKVAFLTKRLELTPAEAQVFWPIYNEYQERRDNLRKQAQEDRKKVREQSDKLTEEELRKLADAEMEFRKNDVALQAEMHEKLKKVLPARKLALLYVAEEDFKKELIRLLSEDNNATNAGAK
ncbi:MAG: hypothetical protein ACRCYO_04365 [Bacteroidia bacterium]